MEINIITLELSALQAAIAKWMRIGEVELI